MMSKIFNFYSAQPIVVERLRLSIEPYRCTAGQREMLRYVIEAYGFLLRSKLDGCTPKRFSFGQFAASIGEVYDVKAGHHAESVELLDALERSQSMIAGLPILEFDCN